MDDVIPQDPPGQSPLEPADRAIAKATGHGRTSGLTMIRTSDGGYAVFNAAGRVEYASSPHVVAEARQRFLQGENDRGAAVEPAPRLREPEPAAMRLAAAARPDGSPARVVLGDGGAAPAAAPVETLPAGGSVFSPADIRTPQGRKRRVAAVIELQETYLTQRHRWSVGERWIELRPTGDHSNDEGAPTQPPPAAGGPTDRWLVTAWNPQGRGRSAPENLTATADLVVQVRALGAHPIRTVATLPPDRGWVEQTLVLADIDEVAAVALGRRFGQAAVTLWRGETLTIVPTGVSDDVQRKTIRCTHALLPPVCPITNSVPKHPDCRPRFCPGTSGAIHYFALRAAQRRLFLLLTGCPVCGRDAQLPTLEDFSERLVLASRYGSHVWAPWEA